MEFVLEIIGTIAFAISGAAVAVEKKMDIFGVAILGMTTAVGGGVVRDILLGTVPPAAFQKPVYALVAVAVSLVVFIPAIGQRIKSDNPVLLVMDTLGLAVFTAVGTRAGIPYSNTFLALFVGVVTGVGGGVIRDLFAGNRPYIFIKHFYACASLAGSVVMVVLWPFGEKTAMIAGILVIITLRLLAAKFRWSLPKAK
ncbi:MAG: TRIC cation channel family protein [Eubacteriales bacterium]|nr:TRIC cation channel family protein [Eubacteriales bacterium]